MKAVDFKIRHEVWDNVSEVIQSKEIGSIYFKIEDDVRVGVESSLYPIVMLLELEIRK